MIITTYSVFLLHHSLFFTWECSNSLLGFLDLSLLTNLFIFPLPRTSYAAPASNCQGWCFIPTTEHRSPTHLWCDAAAVRVQTLLFTFALLDSFFPLLPHLSSPAHTLSSSSVSSDKEIAQGSEQVAPSARSPHPTVPGHKTAPAAPNLYRLAQTPPSAQGSGSFAHRQYLWLFSGSYEPVS